MSTLRLNRSIYKIVFVTLLLPFLFNSCILNKQIPDGANDFHTMMEKLVANSYVKLEKNIMQNDVILVSDFVNLDRLQNHSKLGFLLSDTLKNSLLNKNIIVREVELGQDFRIGKHGFNMLSRKQNEIYSDVENERFAVVGTYSVTTKRLILFIKLIDIRTGSILSSSTESTMIDEEILELERTPKDGRTIYAPVVL